MKIGKEQAGRLKRIRGARVIEAKARDCSKKQGVDCQQSAGAEGSSKMQSGKQVLYLGIWKVIGNLTQIYFRRVTGHELKCGQQGGKGKEMEIESIGNYLKQFG